MPDTLLSDTLDDPNKIRRALASLIAGRLWDEITQGLQDTGNDYGDFASIAEVPRHVYVKKAERDGNFLHDADIFLSDASPLGARIRELEYALTEILGESSLPEQPGSLPHIRAVAARVLGPSGPARTNRHLEAKLFASELRGQVRGLRLGAGIARGRDDFRTAEAIEALLPQESDCV